MTSMKPFPLSWRLYDWWLFVVPLLLVSIGVAMIASIAYGTPRADLAWNQAIYAGIGIVIMIILARVDYRLLRSLAYPFYCLVLALLAAVKFYGVTIFGAERWLVIGGFQLQPSELAKLALILVLAVYMTSRDSLKLRDYFNLLILIGLPLIAVLYEPDMGTAAIIAITAFCLLSVAGLSKRILLGVVAAGLISLPIIWGLMADYQRGRVITFLNPNADPYGAGYNVLQALIAVGSGGLFGQGLGQGSQSQLQFLPVTHTDFIFAGIAEATGLVGSLVLIGLLVFLTQRIIRVAQLSKDRLGMIIAFGVATLIFSESAINIAMNLGLVPVTGIPLPFVSQGGTALIVNFAALGILQSILSKHKKITF